MYDIFDAPAWKEFMGPCTYPNRRIGLSCLGLGLFTLLLVIITLLSSLVPKLTSLLNFTNVLTCILYQQYNFVSTVSLRLRTTKSL